MRPYIIAAFTLHFFCPVHSQTFDSLRSAADSSKKVFEEINKDFQHWEDSVYKLKIQSSLAQNGKNLDSFLAGMKERQDREKRQLYIRIGLGILFLGVLIVASLKRRKARLEKNQNSTS